MNEPSPNRCRFDEVFRCRFDEDVGLRCRFRFDEDRFDEDVGLTKM